MLRSYLKGHGGNRGKAQLCFFVRYPPKRVISGARLTDRIVVYDVRGVVSAARVWWTFRAFGHDAVAVLDGGLRKWRAEGRPVESGTPEPRARTFQARLRPELVRDMAAVRARLYAATAAGHVGPRRAKQRDPDDEPAPEQARRSSAGSRSAALAQDAIEVCAIDGRRGREANQHADRRRYREGQPDDRTVHADRSRNAGPSCAGWSVRPREAGPRPPG